MPEYVVHMKTSGVYGEWRMLTGEGDTFPEAAIAAVVQYHQDHGLDLANIPHRVEFKPGDDGDRYYTVPTVLFVETEPRRIFDPLLLGGWGDSTPGHPWFGCQVLEGKPDDCPNCGGRGIDSNNPFRQCARCGDYEAKVAWHHVGGGHHDYDPATTGSGKAS